MAIRILTKEGVWV